MSKSTQSSISHSPIPYKQLKAFLWVIGFHRIWIPKNIQPLADTFYLPYLNLLWELLRQQADQIMPHPITTSIKPSDLILLKDLWPSPLGPWWTGPRLVILAMPTAVKLNGAPLVAAPFKDKTLLTNFRLFHYKKGWVLLHTTGCHMATPPLQTLSLFHSCRSS
jgi:hypothetical protein